MNNIKMLYGISPPPLKEEIPFIKDEVNPNVIVQKVKIKQTENQVKADISEFLSLNHVPHWRQNSGGRKAEHKGKIRWFWFMQWLWPDKYERLVFLDIGGILPDGRYFEIEVKATGKKPSMAQYRTMNFINEHTRAVALWADSLDMFIAEWEKITNES